MAICGILGKYSKTETTLFEISKLRVLRPKLYLNIEVYLRRGDICYVGTPFGCPIITGFSTNWELCLTKMWDLGMPTFWYKYVSFEG